MRVLVVSEGDHDIGKRGLEGALPLLVKRILPSVTSTDVRKTRDHTRRFHGKGNKWLKLVWVWLIEAQDGGFDALVFVVDQDRDRSRKAHLDQAQDDETYAMPRAIGLAIETFDAWMLADETALSQVLDRTIQKQASPESMRYPKKHSEQFAREASLGASELYAQIAETSRIEQLVRECPRGFGVFHARLKRLAS